jgi:hypothetical protein
MAYVISMVKMLYSASILFGHEEAGASALGLTGSLDKAGSFPNKNRALYNTLFKKLGLSESKLLHMNLIFTTSAQFRHYETKTT